MSSEYIIMKQALQKQTKTKFNELLDKCMFSEDEKRLMYFYYVDKKSMQWIANELGIAYLTVMQKHKKALKYINKNRRKILE